jgi:hypothetical protein
MSFLQRLKDATIGFSGYPRLARSRWAFGFMALLLLFGVAVGTVRWTAEVRDAGRKAAQALVNGPDWGLVNGKFHYDGPMPATIDGTIVIDTTGSYKPERLQSQDRAILITGDMLYNWNAGQMQEVPLSDLPFDFTRADLSNLLQRFYVYMPLVGAFVFVFQLAFKALDAVILAVIGQLSVGSKRGAVPFGLAYTVALYAMTLPILLQWVFGLSSLGWPFFLWWGLAIIYTIGGLRAYFKGADVIPE